MAKQQEKAPLGRQILSQLQENMEIAEKDMIPICQDTGMAVVFLKVGQDVHFVGGNVEDAVNEGVRRGYVDGYLRILMKDSAFRIRSAWFSMFCSHVNAFYQDCTVFLIYCDYFAFFVFIFTGDNSYEVTFFNLHC